MTYDHVSWKFLCVLLIYIRLDVSMVNQIMRCISYIFFIVLIYETLSSFFHPSHYLRKGCPISPSLFLLVEDCLSNSNKERKIASLKNMKILLPNTLFHFIFIDDILFISLQSLSILSLFQKDLLILWSYYKCFY